MGKRISQRGFDQVSLWCDRYKKQVFNTSILIQIYFFCRFKEDDNFHGTSMKMDVTNIDDIVKVKEAIDELVRWDGLWCVVNNAGKGLS